MDGTQFDGIVRSLTSPASRRGVLGGLLGAVLGVAAAARVDRDSVSADARGTWSRNEQTEPEFLARTDTSTYGSLGVGYSHSLWAPERRVNGDSRLELSLRYANRSLGAPSVVPEYPRPGRDVRQLSTSWLRRNSWGTLRLGAGYAW